MSRLFVAISLPEHTAAQISRDLLRPIEQEIRVVRRDNLHITLCFIGEGDEDEVASKLSEVRFRTFTFALSGVGRFGTKVIWLGAEGGELADLACRVCETLGMKNDFLGHLTLARGKRRSDFFRAWDKIKENAFFEQVAVDRFLLIRSATTPNGPEYKVVREFLCGDRLGS